MYFGSLLGTYNGVYVELVVEPLEAEMNWIELWLLPQLGYRSKPFLCYRLTYKGQKRYGQYQLFEALMNFSQVQEAMLRDLGELHSFDSNE